MIIFKLTDKDLGKRIYISGIIAKIFKSATSVGVKLVDLEGNSLILSFSNSEWEYFKANNSDLQFSVGNRIEAKGEYYINGRNLPGLKDISEVKVVEFMGKLYSLEDSLYISTVEHVLLNHRINIIEVFLANYLTNEGYLGVSSNLISSSWAEFDSLDLLEAHFPGFGISGYLIPSPAPLINRYMSLCKLDKVYSMTTSFITNFRFDGGGCEMKICYIKKYGYEDIIKFIKEITINIYKKALKINIPKFICSQRHDFSNASFQGDGKNLMINQYSCSMNLKNQYQHVEIYQIIHLLDWDGNLLLECSIEKDEKEQKALNCIIYVSQFVNSITSNKKKSTHVDDLS